MKIIRSIPEMRQITDEIRRAGREIVLIPTMGSLHRGHISLAELALSAPERNSTALIMSVFVNPMQFGANEDFGSYPRNLNRDAEIAAEAGIEFVFAPSSDEMYPEGFSSLAEVTGLDKFLCGASRPGHFRGVTTVVMKLMQIIRPAWAVFGKKDAQQAIIIQKMVRDLNIPVKLLLAPIVREKDGLAMSSRNIYLSAEERRQAVYLSAGIFAAKRLFNTGERKSGVLLDAFMTELKRAPLAALEYAEVVSMNNLSPVNEVLAPAILAAAARFGATRLIDNVFLILGDGLSD